MTRRKTRPRPLTRAEEAAITIAAVYDLDSPEEAERLAAEVLPTDSRGRSSLDGNEAAPRPERGRRPCTRAAKRPGPR